MTIEFLNLIARDHREIVSQLVLMSDPSASISDQQSALEVVTLGLTAHAEAEGVVLASFADIPGLQCLIAQVQAEHLAQERALSRLVCAPLGTPCAYDRAADLRDMIEHHARKEEAYLPAAFAMHAPREAYARLAAAFATERLRQLGMLHPSLEPESTQADSACR